MPALDFVRLCNHSFRTRRGFGKFAQQRFFPRIHFRVRIEFLGTKLGYVFRRRVRDHLRICRPQFNLRIIIVGDFHDLL